MARIRTIKPQAFRSQHLSQVDRGVRWTFAGLWCLSDDQGRLRDDVRAIWADLYLHDDDVTPTTVDHDLKVLADVGLICRYVLGGHRYLHVPTFLRHQRINHPSAVALPPCPVDHAFEEGALFPSSQLETPVVRKESARSPLPGSGSGSGSGSGKQVVGDAPETGRQPTRLPDGFQPDDVTVAAVERKRPDVDWRSEHPRFVAYWQARTGKAGEKSDWQATWRNWMGRARGARNGYDEPRGPQRREF